MTIINQAFITFLTYNQRSVGEMENGRLFLETVLHFVTSISVIVIVCSSSKIFMSINLKVIFDIL